MIFARYGFLVSSVTQKERNQILSILPQSRKTFYSLFAVVSIATLPTKIVRFLRSFSSESESSGLVFLFASFDDSFFAKDSYSFSATVAWSVPETTGSWLLLSSSYGISSTASAFSSSGLLCPFSFFLSLTCLTMFILPCFQYQSFQLRVI